MTLVIEEFWNDNGEPRPIYRTERHGWRSPQEFRQAERNRHAPRTRDGLAIIHPDRHFVQVVYLA